MTCDPLVVNGTLLSSEACPREEGGLLGPLALDDLGGPGFCFAAHAPAPEVDALADAAGAGPAAER